MKKDYLKLIEEARPLITFELMENVDSMYIAYRDFYLNKLLNAPQKYIEKYFNLWVGLYMFLEGKNKDVFVIKFLKLIRSNSGFPFPDPLQKKLQDYFVKEYDKNGKIEIKQYKGFQSKITEKQIKNLFAKLIGSYIDDKTSFEHFKAIFKNAELPSGFIKIKWIDKPKTRPEPNSKTLFELLFLLKEKGYLINDNFDTSNKNKNNLYSRINSCFSGINNIGKKNPDKYTFLPQQRNKREKALKDIITSL